MLDVRPPAAPGPDAAARQDGYGAYAEFGLLETLRRLDSSPRGLTEAEAELRLARLGENAVLPFAVPSWGRRALTMFSDPFVALLGCLSVVCALIGSWGSVAVIAVLTSAACAVRLAGEGRAARAVAGLLALLPTTATVLRRAEDGGRPLAREVPTEQLVRGDIVRLTAGEPVPADLRLLRADGLTVDQGVLTGESEPVARYVPQRTPAPGPAPDPFAAPQLCFAGSRVATGTATGVVIATGVHTRFGSAHRGFAHRGFADSRTVHLWSRPGRPGRPSTRSRFERGVRRAIRALILFMLAAVPLTITVDAWLRGWSADLLPFAVATAVGLTPELLPVVLTTVFARSSRRLASDQVLVRRLPAVAELGVLDVLCVDKTGTLTTGGTAVDDAFGAQGGPDLEPLYWAAVHSEVCYELGVPDEVDEALLAAADGFGLLGPAYDVQSLFAPRTRSRPEPVSLLPFDPATRCSTAVVRTEGRRTALLKGAPEAVLARCTGVREGDREVELDPERRAAVERLVERCADGRRLLAMALTDRPGPGTAEPPAGDFVLLGFVALQDEPVDSAAEALAELRESGVRIKVVTGDHPETAVRLCSRLGIEPAHVLLGPELDGLDDRQLVEAVGTGTVFARCTPEQKARIVTALRSSDHTVGHLGDGVNDVPALRAADVSICTADAVGAAREWADVVLGARDLTVLGKAVAVGRASIGNVTAYLRIALSCNLGNTVSMLVGGVLLPFLPMLPVQVLAQNLCFDAAQLSLAFGGSGRGRTRPATLRWGVLGWFALGFGLLNSLTDLALFLGMDQVTDGFTRPDSAGLFHTAWFTENLLTQALSMPLLYGLSRPGRTPRAVWWAAGALTGVGVLLPVTGCGRLLGFEPLPASAVLPLALAVAAYALTFFAARTALLARSGSATG